MGYILKVTLCWALFLLLFELLFRYNGRFTANRIMLLTSTVMGLMLPLFSLPYTSANLSTAAPRDYIYSLSRLSVPASPISAPAVSIATHGFQWPGLLQCLMIIYAVGAFLVLFKCVLDLYKIFRLVKRHKMTVLERHSVIETGGNHGPFSFLHYIFISRADAYSPQEQTYILAHEHAHFLRKQWIDLWLMQLICAFCWFHPLVWRYRRLLTEQHEFEADELAAKQDAYGYGLFLLQQSLTGGRPSIAHTFHFSPVKNRIHMLTKKNKAMHATAWKYALLIPGILACTFIVGKADPKGAAGAHGNTIIVNGNEFTWRYTDTAFYDREKKLAVLIPGVRPEKRQLITLMNGEDVYDNDYLKEPATYTAQKNAFVDYLAEQFRDACRGTADSNAFILGADFVIDKQGKIVYHYVSFDRVQPYNLPGRNQWDPLARIEPNLNAKMDKIIKDAPQWKPAMKDGKPVPVFVTQIRPGC